MKITPTYLRFYLGLMQIINRTNEIEISSMQSIKKMIFIKEALVF
jgi:hypothetical protein